MINKLNFLNNFLRRLSDKNVSDITVYDLARIIKVKRTNINVQIGKRRFNRVLTQTNYVTEEDVFISVPWYSYTKSIPEALEKKAIAIFCSKEAKKQFPQKNVFEVDDPLQCVYLFEEWRSRGYKEKRITITGSVGKTTTTGLINNVVCSKYCALTHHSATNSHGGILRNVQKLNSKHEFWVQEVGGVQPGYIESSARFLRPDIVVVTNIGESHLNLYKTKQNIYNDKLSLEKYAKKDAILVTNYDDDMLRDAEYTHRTIFCSIANTKADYYAKNISIDIEGTHFDIVNKRNEYHIDLSLYGEHNIYDALFAFAVGDLTGVDRKTIINSLRKYRPNGMRQNMVNIGGYHLFVDTFNAEPKTVLGAAKTLEKLTVNSGKKIFVSGHIDKLGKDSIEMHNKLGHDLAKLKIDHYAFFAGDSIYTYKAMIEDGIKNIYFTNNRDEIDSWVKTNINRNDIAFFKSGQFEAGLAKTIDHVYGTKFQNQQQYNEGQKISFNGLSVLLRQDNIAEILAYKERNKYLEIPASYNSCSIIRICDSAFLNNKNIEKILIQNGIVNIGKKSFYGCDKLKDIIMPRTLKIIEDSAFESCKKITEIKIPKGVIHIGNSAFRRCELLERIYIPNTVGYIGNKAFDETNKSKLTICCSKNSFIETYAKENGISYTLVNE